MSVSAVFHPFLSIERPSFSGLLKSFLCGKEFTLYHAIPIVKVRHFLLTQCFLPNQQQIASLAKHLTHSHTMTPFDTPGKQAF